MKNEDNFDALKWEEIRTEHIVKDKWIDFRRSAYRFPDGTEFEPFYSYSRRDYVVIVPITEDGKLVCVRQFRHGIKEVTTEFPAGGLERSNGVDYRTAQSDPAGEDALEAAKRELLEETGYSSDKWTFLLSIPSNATIADNTAYIYLAEGCQKIAGQELDSTEFLTVAAFTPDELEKLIQTGNFQQAMHVLGWLMVKEKLRGAISEKGKD